MEKYYLKSPIGVLEIVCEDDALLSLKLVKSQKKSSEETGFVKIVKQQLKEYFSGKRENFEIKINPHGSAFQKKVWAELLKIPYGTTKSYSDIAKSIGNINAQRAVGSACNKNPVIIIVPCHRVISKNGKLGGYAHGEKIKEKLLALEKRIDI